MHMKPRRRVTPCAYDKLLPQRPETNMLKTSANNAGEFTGFILNVLSNESHHVTTMSEMLALARRMSNTTTTGNHYRQRYMIFARNDYALPPVAL